MGQLLDRAPAVEITLIYLIPLPVGLLPATES